MRFPTAILAALCSITLLSGSTEAANSSATHPYICFSTQQTNALFEVFAVFVTTVELPYNVPTLDAAQRAAVVDVAQFYSIYDYGVTVADSDKLLTLSSESYVYDANYPNNYRFVIMARLVDQNSALKNSASFTENTR